MITQFAAAVLFAAVAAGVLLQVATVARVGSRIARVRVARRMAKWRKSQPKPARPAVRPMTALRLLARRRCREYRTALRTARA